MRVGEIAPTCFDDPAVPERVYAHNPECRILVSLRHPVERAQSLYRHHLTRGRVTGTFTDAAARIPRILDAGNYREHVSRWLGRFAIGPKKRCGRD